MAYHIDAAKISLDDLRKRIEGTDLVPSRACLATDLEAKMNALRRYGIMTLAHLRVELKTPKRLSAVAKATGMEVNHLTLLRREVEGYFPKPVALSAFDLLPKGEITRLERNGIRNTADLYEATGNSKRRTELAKLAGIAMATLEALVRLADLSRVQWVSPTYARMLVEAGYDSVVKVAAAEADSLSTALAQTNVGARYFKGTIGLRDVNRLVLAARNAG